MQRGHEHLTLTLRLPHGKLDGASIKFYNASTQTCYAFNGGNKSLMEGYILIRN